MPFGQTRVVVGEIVVEGTVVEGTVVEGTVVDVVCGTVVTENGEVEGVVEGEMLGVWPKMLLPPALELPSVGVEPTVLPSWLGGVPVMLGVGVTPNGDVVMTPGVVGEVVAKPGVVDAAPGVVTVAPGAAAPAPGVPTWASTGNAARVAASRSCKRSGSSMEVSFVTRLDRGNHASFVPTRTRDSAPSP